MQRTGSAKKATIVVYYVTGRQLGPISVPVSWCRECDLTVRAVTSVIEELRATDEIDFIAKPWVRHLFEPLRHGGMHPPIVLIGGRVFSQGVVPDKASLRQRLLSLMLNRVE
jgi:hypothetical protein